MKVFILISEYTEPYEKYDTDILAVFTDKPSVEKLKPFIKDPQAFLDCGCADYAQDPEEIKAYGKGAYRYLKFDLIEKEVIS